MTVLKVGCLQQAFLFFKVYRFLEQSALYSYMLETRISNCKPDLVYMKNLIDIHGP